MKKILQLLLLTCLFITATGCKNDKKETSDTVDIDESITILQDLIKSVENNDPVSYNEHITITDNENTVTIINDSKGNMEYTAIDGDEILVSVYEIDDEYIDYGQTGYLDEQIIQMLDIGMDIVKLSLERYVGLLSEGEDIKSSQDKEYNIFEGKNEIGQDFILKISKDSSNVLFEVDNSKIKMQFDDVEDIKIP